MKKTLNINVAGYPFVIDEDAYEILNDYLDTIDKAFSKQEDGKLITEDIENRVAELLIEKTEGRSIIITKSDVRNIISRIGQPDEIIETDTTINMEFAGMNVSAEESVKSGTTPPPYVPPFTEGDTLKKKLFRDPKNMMLGGVCSGLAWYFNIDPTIVRLLCVLLAFLSLTTFGIAYIILWIIVPEARTPLERMQMMGEKPTVNNIGRTVTNDHDFYKSEEINEESPKTKNIGNSIVRFFAVMAKIFLIAVAIIACPVLLALIIAFFVLLCAFLALGTNLGINLFGEVLPDWYIESGSLPLVVLLCILGVIISIGIPLYCLIRIAFKSGKNKLSQKTRNCLMILFVIGILMTLITGKIISINNKINRLKNVNMEVITDKTTEWEEEQFSHEIYLIPDI